MVVTARPPSTYTFIISLQFISIIEKLYFLLLHVESNRFLALLKFLNFYYWCGVVAVGGSARRECKLLLLLLRKEACVLHSCRVEIFEQVSKLPFPFSFSLSCGGQEVKFKNKIKFKVAAAAAIAAQQPSIACHRCHDTNYSVHRAASVRCKLTLQRYKLPQRRSALTCRNAASCRSVAALQVAAASQRYKLVAALLRCRLQ